MVARQLLSGGPFLAEEARLNAFDVREPLDRPAREIDDALMRLGGLLDHEKSAPFDRPARLPGEHLGLGWLQQADVGETCLRVDEAGLPQHGHRLRDLLGRQCVQRMSRRTLPATPPGPQRPSNTPR